MRSLKTFTVKGAAANFNIVAISLALQDLYGNFIVKPQKLQNVYPSHKQYYYKRQRWNENFILTIFFAQYEKQVSHYRLNTAPVTSHQFH